MIPANLDGQFVNRQAELELRCPRDTLHRAVNNFLQRPSPCRTIRANRVHLQVSSTTEKFGNHLFLWRNELVIVDQIFRFTRHPDHRITDRSGWVRARSVPFADRPECSYHARNLEIPFKAKALLRS
jgi:hypothetical protein